MAEDCDWCGEQFEDAETLLHHIRGQHVPKTRTPAPCERPSTSKQCSNSFNCDTCGKSYASKRSLQRHVREKHKHSEVKCDKCEKAFTNIRTLKKHTALKHERSVSRCFKCAVCSKKFSEKWNLKTHSKVCGKSRRLPKQFSCLKCKMSFKGLRELYNHRWVSHPARHDKTYACNGCWRRFRSRGLHTFHINSCSELHKKEQRAQSLVKSCLYKTDKSQTEVEGNNVWETTTAMDGLARIHSFPIFEKDDLNITLIKNKGNIEGVLKKDLTALRRMKWYLTAYVKIKGSETGDEMDMCDGPTRYMRCKPIITLHQGELDRLVGEGILGVLSSFDKAVDEGSKMLFESVEKLELRVVKYSPLKGSSFLPLPDWLNKPFKGLINIQNHGDDKCFLWTCLAGVRHPRIHPERVQNYINREHELNMNGISYPVKLRDIDKFERNNPWISVSVFGIEQVNKPVIVPLRVTKSLQRCHINMLLLRDFEDRNGFDDVDENDIDSHYVLIKDESRFFAHLTKCKRKLFWCENCLTPRKTYEKHIAHRQKCIEFESQALKMPTRNNNVMRFTEYEKQYRHDYVIYADLECILKPIHTALPDPSKSSTTKLQEHVPCGFCYVIVDHQGNLLKPPVLEHGEGPEVIRSLILHLQEEERNIVALREQNEFPIDMTEESWALFNSSGHCFLCEQPIPREGVNKVRHHDHRIEKNNFVGACCESPCNLNLKQRDFIPVFFHGLANYDAHCIISQIGEFSNGSDIKCIPKNKERYISFSFGRLRFLDSFNFLGASLQKLVEDISPDNLKHLQTIFPDCIKRNLVSRKGVYCYNYFDSFEKFEETTIPPPACFTNDLTGEPISEEDYAHCLNVFKTFEMKNLWDYHDLYLLTDVVLLCDTMETYRTEMLNKYRLDICQYYTTPGFAWSSALLYSGQSLTLLDDINMHLMFEKGLRGGVSSINCRSADAKNHYVTEGVSPDDPSNIFIMNLDANNLYGAAMSLPLPVGNFKFLSPEEIQNLDINNFDEHGSVGYVLDVSLRYNEKLHDIHNDLPLAPDHIAPSYDELSPLQKEMIERFNLPKTDQNKKLVPNFYDKDSYVVYASTLKLYLELGLELIKINRAISFDQKPWLKGFIAHNTVLRQNAKSTFTKNLFKLLSNSCFGKSIESIRNRKNLDFTKKPQKFKKLVNSPLFHSFEIFDHGLVAVERKKATILLNRPSYSGMVILDNSKSIVYKFHYQVMKPIYHDRIKVLGTDTDSLFYKITTADVYKDMQSISQHLDTSDYPVNHELYSLVNKKVLAKFKDEMNGVPIVAYRALRSKMYSFKDLKTVKCVGKGIHKSAIRSQLTFEDYDKCLKDFSVKKVTFKKISTDGKHHLFTTFSTKCGLSCFDNKRYIEEDNVNTVAFGHNKLKQNDERGNLGDADVNSEMVVPPNDFDDDSDDEGQRNLRELIDLMDAMEEE